MNRASAAGIFAGSYHFSRPDVIASTLNANGIANSGADEADHFMQMAGPFIRPGYLLPTHDLEAGQSQRSGVALSQFTVDFSNRMYEPKKASFTSYVFNLDGDKPLVVLSLGIDF